MANLLFVRIKPLLVWITHVAVVVSFTCSLHSSFPLSPSFSCFLSLFSPHLFPLGVQAFASSLQIWNGPNLDQMFTHRHPKYMQAHSALRQHTGPRALELQIVIWYVSVVISEIIDSAVLPCIFLFYTLWTFFSHIRMYADAHTHIHTPSSLSWCGWQLLWNGLHSWQENHKFLIQTSTLQCFGRERETPLLNINNPLSVFDLQLHGQLSLHDTESLFWPDTMSTIPHASVKKLHSFTSNQQHKS